MSKTTTIAGETVTISESFAGKLGRPVIHAQYVARGANGRLLAQNCATVRDAIRSAAMTLTNLPACELHQVGL